MISPSIGHHACVEGSSEVPNTITKQTFHSTPYWITPRTSTRTRNRAETGAQYLTAPLLARPADAAATVRNAETPELNIFGWHKVMPTNQFLF